MSIPPSVGQVLHGFRILRVVALPELPGQAVEARHSATGARLLSLSADDRENVFAVAFATPPADNCGTPHILEHAVLAGSRRFPVKDPFAEMLKSSMATFINAFTCSDRTLYPVASNVPQDYFNLADVYLDAVFHPLLSPDTFMQEGWHWAVGRTAAGTPRVEPQGVVLNEMRGAYSEFDALVEREAAARLFPVGTYGLDAGGEPDRIPDLAYADFAAWYARRYHPANARFFLYGDIPLETKLCHLGERLLGVACRPFAPPVLRREPRWRRPRRARVSVSGLAEDDAGCTAATTLNWLVGELGDPETDLTWGLLDRLLLGDDAAPLRRRLLESGLGDDLTSAGYLSDSLQTVFQVGIKGRRAVTAARLEALVLGALAGAVREGFPPERVRDALRQLEYSYREIDSGFPLHLMEDAFNVWLHGFDPLSYLRLGPALQRLRERVERDPGLLTRVIARELLGNPHRLTLAVQAGHGRRSEREQRLLDRAQTLRRSLSPAELDGLQERSAALARRQSQPNPPEALATLPVLRLEDLPREPAAIRTCTEPLPNGALLLRQDVPSNGISYLTLAFDLSGLPEELLPYVPVYSAFLTRLGTRRRDFASLSEALTRNTGGAAGTVHVSPSHQAPGAARPFLVVQARTLDETCAAAIELLDDMLDGLDVSADRRLQELLAQRRARMLTGIVSQGHHLAVLQAANHLNPYGRLCNLWWGQPQIHWAQAMAAGGAAPVPEALERIGAWLRAGCRTYASITGTDRACAALRGWAAGRAAVAPDGAVPLPADSGLRAATAPVTCFAYPLDVAFCARCLPAAHLADPQAPLLQLGTHILSYTYLWEEVRAKGGAYGAFCAYEPAAGRFSMASHCDPGIARTLGVFDGLTKALESSAWSDADLARAAIACARDEETPIRPGMATDVALWRHVAGITQELRRAWRRALLEAAPAAVREAMLAMVRQGAGCDGTAVLSSRRRLAEAARASSSPFLIRSLTGSSARRR